MLHYVAFVAQAAKLAVPTYGVVATGSAWHYGQKLAAQGCQSRYDQH